MVQQSSADQALPMELEALKSQGQLAISWRQLRRNKGAILGGVLILIEILVAILAPYIAPYEPIDQILADALTGPSKTHLLGTDEVGRDIFSRIIYGTRISLRIGLISVGIASVFGVALGLVAGYYGGFLDDVILRGVDVWLAFPGILLAMAIVAVLGPSIFNVMIAVGFSSIPTYVRITRSSVLSAREMEYVMSARAVGCQGARIMVRHILPNVLAPVIVISTLGVAGAILTAAALSFIGLGAQPPTPEWGAILSVGRQFMRRAWWLTTFPGLAIMITVLGINMFGDGLRDALDPRLRM